MSESKSEAGTPPAQEIVAAGALATTSAQEVVAKGALATTRAVVAGARDLGTFVEEKGWAIALFSLGTVLVIGGISVEIADGDALAWREYVAIFILATIYISFAFVLRILTVRATQRSVEIAYQTQIRAEERAERAEIVRLQATEDIARRNQALLKVANESVAEAHRRQMDALK